MNSLEQFNPNRFISKLLGKGDIEGLFEKFSLLDIDEEEAMNKFMKGVMTLGDYYGYFKQMLSLGSISSLLNMIPGVKNIKIPDESKFKRMTYAFDSMSKSELNSFGDLFVKEPNRLKRISRGSGISIDELNETIQNYKLINQFSKKLLNNQNLKNLSESNHLRNQVSEYLGFNFDDMMDDLEKFKSKKTDDFNDLS
ncbi:SRP54 [Hepatospora eriocheir]|uniref:SRP54 n=1 Tax=Hepatospora eriocheir TaxID=1081669 RepID=A0A1X0QK12_9MICR|nr:SRP54 [Hepatospora eriocheir]